ncbi:hypothetical protein AWC35_14720 [Gibbsiella quercinecans]|uniref:Uncharacterized protein n=1 Tax=Gibbsiella quercinecans TaxID=929813 RepID=A0A250B2L8_9GAMM|nr:hypothetical protein AWC35_14720 [Gibbsiella quercinecans]RLM07502.1 hypothetical protein BIY30_14590 [Gibbsiella quercinecans]RLM10788.1 hypothetical protein BIY31_06790 [Gibbsiella quercinecans]
MFILFSLKNHHEAVLPAGGEPEGRVDCCPLAALQWPALPGLMNRFFSHFGPDGLSARYPQE